MLFEWNVCLVCHSAAMLTSEHLRLPVKELAKVLGVQDIYLLEYKPTAARTFSAVVVYGVIAGKQRTVYEWFEQCIKYQLRKTTGNFQFMPNKEV